MLLAPDPARGQSGEVLETLLFSRPATSCLALAAAMNMGLCRSAVYVTAGLAAGGIASHGLLTGALAGGAYVVGLTFVARQENRKSFRAGATLLLLASPALLAVAHPTRGVVVWMALAVAVAWAIAAVVRRPCA